MKPILFRSPLLHRNFVRARHQFIELVRSSPGGKVIALVGPTHVGKSLIVESLLRTLESDLRPTEPATMPLIHLVVATSNDGRVSPKHLTLKLLKAVKHPLFEHDGEMDERDYYRPSRGRDEGSMRVALEAALDYRNTILVVLDEAHHLTHTKNRELRSNVLQSIKCLCAIKRTLVLVGGYELAYQGLFDSAHFAGRLACIELPPYVANAIDLDEWDRILKFCSKYVPVSPASLLIDNADDLLEATNGCFGLLEKVLWFARSIADGGAITKSTLRAAFPTQAEHSAIRSDIQAGQRALGNLKSHEMGEDPTSFLKRTHRQKPFKRKPNRVLPTYPEVANE